MTTKVEVKHDGKTLAFECAETETFETFVERVREGFGTTSTSASRATFLSAGGARVAGDDVAFDFGALLRKNSRRGRLKMMMVVASAGGGERRRVAGGASRGVEALRAARAEKSAREEARREANGSSSSSIEARKTAWASTGIVGMRNAGATEMDDAVFELGERVRVVDAAGNALTSVPAAIARLTNLTRLTLRENALRGDGVPWSSFASLRALTFLDVGKPRRLRSRGRGDRVRVASHAVAGAVWFVETFTGGVFPIVTKIASRLRRGERVGDVARVRRE